MTNEQQTSNKYDINDLTQNSQVYVYIFEGMYWYIKRIGYLLIGRSYIYKFVITTLVLVKVCVLSYLLLIILYEIVCSKRLNTVIRLIHCLNTN